MIITDFDPLYEFIWDNTVLGTTTEFMQWFADENVPCKNTTKEFRTFEIADEDYIMLCLKYL